MRDKIAHNVEEVRKRVRLAAEGVGRDPDSVRLIPVTKSVGLREVRALMELGLMEFGENRVEVAREKIEQIGPGIRWRMIGNIQRRKCRDVVELFDAVDAVDRVKVAEALSRRCQELNRDLPVLLEINVSGEASKHGFAPDELGEVLSAVAQLPHIRVEGLMTMAPLTEDPETVRPVFRALRELAVRHKLPELSMGMSNDYEVAVQEGATQVRIGTALFE